MIAAATMTPMSAGCQQADATRGRGCGEDVDLDFEGRMSRRGCPNQQDAQDAQDALTVDGIAEEVGEDAEETQVPRRALRFIGSLRVVVVRMLRCVSGDSPGPRQAELTSTRPSTDTADPGAWIRDSSRSSASICCEVP